uniref:Uncharacterized protein n=1 Tax=Knipowitschia caucasica TaxID=637954 RepID=A0AAV2MTQ4_KNICA
MGERPGERAGGEGWGRGLGERAGGEGWGRGLGERDGGEGWGRGAETGGGCICKVLAEFQLEAESVPSQRRSSRFFLDRVCGASVERLWSVCGASVERLWSVCGASVERLWRAPVAVSLMEKHILSFLSTHVYEGALRRENSLSEQESLDTLSVGMWTESGNVGRGS